MSKTVTLFFILFFTSLGYSQDFSNYELTHVRFEGNKQFSSTTLKEVILSKETPFWAWKLLNSVVSKYGSPPAFLDTSFFYIDLIALKNFYNANGFFETDISNRFEIDSVYKTAEIVYLISEGASFLYSKTRFFGFEKLPLELSNDILDKFGTDSTDIFNQQQIERNINGTLNYLFNNGYMKAVYDSSLVFIDTAKNRTNIDLYFSIGKRYIIKEIEVVKKGEGQEFVSDMLIKDIIGISPDEYYDREKIKISQVRLNRTGLFSTIKLDGFEKDSSSVRIPLRFEGVIGNMNELSPELIADNDQNSFNFGLGGNYIRRNFLGDARKLTTNAKIGIIDVFNFNFENLFRKSENRDTTFQGYIELTAKVEQPYVFGRPILGTLETYLKTSTQYQSNITTYGGKITFDFELPEYTAVNQLRSYYNLESYELDTKKPKTTLKAFLGSITSLLGTEFASIKSNDLFFPTTGINLSFIAEAGISYTKTDLQGIKREIDSLKNALALTDDGINVSRRAIFYRSQATMTSFFPLNYAQTAVFAVKTRLGYIQTIYGGASLIPPNRTFTAGGSNSVRGWRARQLVPEDTISFFPLNVGNNIRGGTFLLEGSMEYRYKLLDNIGVNIFGDYGNTWNGYQDFRFDKIAIAVGFGFRYYSSIAPFRIDFGFKMYDPATRQWIFDRPPFNSVEFHFGIGEAF